MTGLKAALDRRIDIHEYLVWSTVLAVLMFVSLRGAFQVGYVIVLVNTLVLLVFDQLAIHRNHMLALLALAGFSLVGARLSGTPVPSVMSQILGIGVMSIYFFSALTSFGPSLSNWMELYMRAAFALTVLCLALWVLVTVVSGNQRLQGIYSEPSYFIYVTLPAAGYCINCYVHERRYGLEALIFLLAYALAESTLGFLGLFLIGLFTYAPRLKGWQMIVGAIVALGFAAGVYAASASVRVRANEMAVAIVKQDLSGTGASAFAFLSNVYVTSQSFLAHPMTGIGIGGYANAYDTYIHDLTGFTKLGTDTTNRYEQSLELNREDAASMFLRVTAELGLPGLIVLVGFLIVCARVRGQPYVIMRNAILPYLIVRMARMGHYFTVELYFFVGLYLLNYLESRRNNRLITSQSSA
ncbi:MAG TPA: hypothetical protein VFI23_15295 [Rhizomicrobium sp.]|nr:hypothetical protein [Rhizomicrobium sp.]